MFYLEFICEMQMISGNLGKFQPVIKYEQITSVDRCNPENLEKINFRRHCILQREILNFGSV